MKTEAEKVAGSFRDPSGFLFKKNDILYRQVNEAYRENYDYLMNSGLYERLTESGCLVKHEEVNLSLALSPSAYKVIRPEPVAFISYPYEWCFSQLRDAALLTLKIQKTALEFGMSLKDASAYNIQFHDGHQVLIDTLSFEREIEGVPWVAYRQYCQHFLGPLLLMAYRDIRMNQLLKLFIDGIPLDLTSRFLPAYTRFLPAISLHIHIHAMSQKRYADKAVRKDKKRIGRNALLGIITSLENATRKIRYRLEKSEWGEYYENTNYSRAAFEHKKRIIAEFIEKARPELVWDLGANLGIFSRIAGDLGIRTISFDIDPQAVEKNYRKCVSDKERNILPLLLDLTNPSPSIGWENKERMSFLDRGPVSMIFALALIHHLAISNNLPFARIAESFQKLCRSLAIEFVPKKDSQVQRLLATREDIFDQYTQSNFEKEFGRYFLIQKQVAIQDSNRILYLMQSRT